MGDGGKWVCGMSRYENYPKNRECIIYSFGVRDESSFGKYLAQWLYSPYLLSYQADNYVDADSNDSLQNRRC